MPKYKYHEKGGKTMFFRKTERTKHSTCLVLAVGALATIGAISVVRYGKQMINGVEGKIKNIFKKGNFPCAVEEME